LKEKDEKDKGKQTLLPIKTYVIFYKIINFIKVVKNYKRGRIKLH